MLSVPSCLGLQLASGQSQQRSVTCCSRTPVRAPAQYDRPARPGNISCAPCWQVVDFWAMNRDTSANGYLREVMSMHHSHDNIGKLIPQVSGFWLLCDRRQFTRSTVWLVSETAPL